MRESDVDGDVRRVPIGAAAERRAEEAEVLGEPDGVAAAGAFVEQLGGERRQARQLRRVVIGAGADQRAQRNERRVVVLRDEQRAGRCRACGRVTCGK